MKYLIILSLFITSYVSAQVPQAINYQGILRNASGQAVSMKTINIQVSITADKTFSISKLLYSERFTVITNEFGTYTISIGYGKPITGTFGGIDWSTGKQWIFVEVDENLNGVYEFVGSMQFASVPYALYSNSARIADSVRFGSGLQGPVGLTGATGPQGPAGVTGAQGPQGFAGATGATGSQGLTGATGAQGLTGATGPQGIQGVAGPTGATGAAGTNGNNGTNGINGATWYTGTIAPSTGTGVVNDFYLNTSNGDYYKKTGASTWTLQANLTGPQGANGATGATGATGAQGIQGVAGPTGATGAAGSNATITMGSIAVTSNVNGGTISSGVLTLAPADATNGGVLTTGVQSITGTKTFVNNLKTNGTLTAGAVTYPNVDGTAGQVLSTTGSGTLTWTTGVSGGTITSHTLGESYGGGKVFWINQDGTHGLIAAEQDQSIVTHPRTGVSWFEAPDYVSNPTNYNGNGNKFTDWRLPSKYELNLLFLNKDQIGNFTTANYWSSTMQGYNDAWWQNFGSGNQGFVNFHSDNGSVRAVRSF